MTSWNSKAYGSFFQADGILMLMRAEMVIQLVWALRPGRRGGINITFLSLAGGDGWMFRV